MIMVTREAVTTREEFRPRDSPRDGCQHSRDRL